VRTRGAVVRAARLPALLSVCVSRRGLGSRRLRSLTLRSDACIARPQDAMSSEIIARVQAFCCKAAELEDRGHLQRAADYFSRAAAEAERALGPDNFATVDMQCSQANTLHLYAVTAANNNAAVDPLAVAAHRTEAIALLSAAVAALERRRVAGTLLEGKCTAVEEAWYVAKLSERDDRMSATEAAWRGSLVGYEIFFDVSENVLAFLSHAQMYAGECSASQFEAFAQLVVHAIELMQLRRCQSTIPLYAEVDFTKTLSVIATDLGARGLDARLVQMLTDAWQRLQRSGVMEMRILDGFRILDKTRRDRQITADSIRDKHDAALYAAMTAPGLRTCALPGCGAKEAHPKHFKRCSACQAVVYCSKEHQLEAWPAHKAACKAARKAKAAASTDGGAGPGAAS